MKLFHTLTNPYRKTLSSSTITLSINNVLQYPETLYHFHQQYNTAIQENHQQETPKPSKPSNETSTIINLLSRAVKQKDYSINHVKMALDNSKINPQNLRQNAVIQVLRKYNSEWITAFGFFKWVVNTGNMKHDRYVNDMMVDILARTKQFKAMWELVEEMKGVSGLLSLSTFKQIIRRYAGAQRFDDCVDTFNNKIGKYGIKRDTNSMNILLDAICKENNVDFAWKEFSELRKMIPPNAHTFNILVHGWCKVRRYDYVTRTMTMMRRHGFEPCVVTYTTLVEAYCREPDFQKVHQLFGEMRENDCAPNVRTYTIVLQAVGKADLGEDAIKIYESMKADGCVPDSLFYNSLVRILGTAGKFKEAYDVLLEMPKHGCAPNVSVYNSLLFPACENLQEELVYELLREMENKDCKPNFDTYAHLLKMCCRLDRMDIIAYLLDDMGKKGLRDDFGIYTMIVHIFLRIGKLENACHFFEEMVGKKLHPRRTTCYILWNCLKAGKDEERKKRIEELLKDLDFNKANDP